VINHDAPVETAFTATDTGSDILGPPFFRFFHKERVSHKGTSKSNKIDPFFLEDFFRQCRAGD
jgi:hypothetical protein